MISRRKFLGMLAILPAVTALAGSGLRLPRRVDVEVVAVKDYFASPDAWYIKTDPPNGLKHFYRNTAGTNAPFSEKSLEDMLSQIRDLNTAAVYPTKLIVPPRLAERAHYVLTHRPTLLERLLWRLFPVD
jgi:hypothetical protein